MSILITILVITAGILALLLIIALFAGKEHKEQREIIINAPVQEVFGYIRLLNNQDNFNTGAMADAGRKKEYKGKDGTVGFIIAWSGNKSVGEGEKEILSITEGKSIVSEIRFVKPMKVSSIVTMSAEPVSDNQTNVTWTNAGKLPYPVNIMIPMLEKNVGKDMLISLGRLKAILEK